MMIFSDPLTELGTFGPQWLLLGIVGTGYVVLIKKLLDAKNDQIEEAKKENARNELTARALLRASDSILDLFDKKDGKA